MDKIEVAKEVVKALIICLVIYSAIQTRIY